MKNHDKIAQPYTLPNKSIITNYAFSSTYEDIDYSSIYNKESQKTSKTIINLKSTKTYSAKTFRE